MTREEAIEIVKSAFSAWESEFRVPNDDWNEEHEALDMAIEALSEPSIVRCKDCIQKHIGGSVTHYYWCDLWDREVDDTDHCAWGEERSEE